MLVAHKQIRPRHAVNRNRPYMLISPSDVSVKLKFRLQSEHVSPCVVNTKGILLAFFPFIVVV